MHVQVLQSVALRNVFTKALRTTISSPLLLSKIFAESFCVASLTCPKAFNRATIQLPGRLILRCSSSDERETSNSLNDALSGMVDKQVEELLNKEENRVLLDGLERASQRVEMAKRELAEIEKQELEAKLLRNYINHLEARAAEIAECQQEISKARAMVDEAGRMLLLSADGVMDRDNLMEDDNKYIDEDKERWESVKAALVSAIIGTFAGLPISITQVTSGTQLVLPLAINFISCALFGVTFRYAVRRDLDNIQLQTGTAAAFGFVKGLAILAGGPPLELNYGSFSSHAFDGALYVSQNLYIFVFAAVGLDLCFKMRLLSPFPMKRLSPGANTK